MGNINASLNTLGLKSPVAVLATGDTGAIHDEAVETLATLLHEHDIEIARGSDSCTENLIHISVASELPEHCAGLRIADVDPRYDAYQLHQNEPGKSLHITASNQRSLLYGVYGLYDALRADVAVPFDIFEKAHFRDRIMCPSIEGRSDKQSNLKYLFRIGINTVFLRARMCPFTDVKHFHFYARDEKHLPCISEHNPPNQEIIEMAQRCHDLASRLGMESIIFMDEPAVIGKEGGDCRQADYLAHETLNGLDEDMTGTPHLKHYREDGWLALSVFHPRVEEHYREMMMQVMELFPNLKGLYLYNEDAAASNCRPQDDPCGRDTYPEGFTGFPYKAYTHLAEVLQTAARKTSPDFRVIIPTFHWAMDDEVRELMLDDFPEESSLNLIAANDCVPYFSRLTGWAKELSSMMKSRPDLEMVCEDDFTGTNEDQLREVTAGYPMPIRTWKKLNVWAREGAVGVIQHHVGGPTFGVNSINDLAFRIFSWTPLMEEKEAMARILKLTEEQLGNAEAAAEMFKAFEAIDRCLDADEDGEADRPYQARFGHAELFAAPLLMEQRDSLRLEVEEYFAAGTEGNPAIWLETLRKEREALLEAITHAAKAVTITPDDRLPVHIYQKDEALSSCRAYAQGMCDAIQIMLSFKTGMLNRLVFAGVDGSGEDEFVAARNAEIANMTAMLPALEGRRIWLQSPPGHRTHQKLFDEVSNKLAAMQSEESGNASTNY